MLAPHASVSRTRDASREARRRGIPLGLLARPATRPAHWHQPLAASHPPPLCVRWRICIRQHPAAPALARCSPNEGPMPRRLAHRDPVTLLGLVAAQPLAPLLGFRAATVGRRARAFAIEGWTGLGSRVVHGAGEDGEMVVAGLAFVRCTSPVPGTFSLSRGGCRAAARRRRGRRHEAAVLPAGAVG
jgi:hypothetical protein